MAQTPTYPIPPVIQDLLRQPQRYAFSQAVHLLRRWANPQNDQELEAFLRGSLRFRPALSLAFAVSDVADLELDLPLRPAASNTDPTVQPFDKARMTATFLGLYGASSPLPKFYTERL